MEPDEPSIELVCTACGHTFSESFFTLQRQPELACPACHQVFRLDTSPLPEPLSHSDSVLADLDKVLSGFGRLERR